MDTRPPRPALTAPTTAACLTVASALVARGHHLPTPFSDDGR